MTQASFLLSEDAFNAYMLRSVMDATATPGETAEEAEVRAAAIVEMFRAFEAANAMESMLACHCITLRFVLNAAMRDAGNLDLEPALLGRMRGMAMAISKNLHLWMTKYQSLHTRNEARAAEAKQAAVPKVEPIATSASVPVQASPPAPAAAPRPEPPAAPMSMKTPPARREPPRPLAAMPSKRPEVAVHSALMQPVARDMKTAGMKDALFASAAAVAGTPPNGRLSIPAGK